MHSTLDSPGQRCFLRIIPFEFQVRPPGLPSGSPIYVGRSRHPKWQIPVRVLGRLPARRVLAEWFVPRNSPVSKYSIKFRRPRCHASTCVPFFLFRITFCPSLASFVLILSPTSPGKSTCGGKGQHWHCTATFYRRLI